MRYAVRVTMEEGEAGPFASGTESGCDRMIDQIMSRQDELGRRATCRVYGDGKLMRVVTMKRWRDERK